MLLQQVPPPSQPLPDDLAVISGKRLFDVAKGAQPRVNSCNHCTEVRIRKVADHDFVTADVWASSAPPGNPIGKD
ncbi:hypothetical protein NLX83_13895 [Allokutzneria sp. A3M-2-11 16]|uniref:hypothetical protein n=1 Tax=Allokutzneria sp. A3M-2-11 16 TaxID=2962043 RepID=UPI0020B708ED|nr:hypothetical protein [Allokutzneria sp. A3M-2-11 16]MCP3800352.1 hypothetical protein [Allokutzneria sp. A3M-2-11 16]